MPRHNPNIPIWDYMDYRVYLKDWYADAKANRRGFSHRAFSEEAGFSSPNFLKLVMDGDRNLTEKSIIPFMKGLRLNKQEQEFFHNLVFFTQAKNHEEKNGFYSRMLQSRKFSQLKPLEKRQFDFYTTWYHPIVRELVNSQYFDGTAEWVAQHVQPAITVAQATKSLELLALLGLIKRCDDGKWQQADNLISTGPEIKSNVLMQYHQNLLELARHQLTAVPAKERDVSSLTLGIKPEQIPLLKEKIREFRRDILKVVSEEEDTTQVVMLNVQLLPVSTEIDKSS